jgi:hypothetical protein
MMTAWLALLGTLVLGAGGYFISVQKAPPWTYWICFAFWLWSVIDEVRG